MSITVSVTANSPLPGGEVLLRGTFTFDALYATGGEVADLSSYILAGTSPTVIVNGDDGYVATHNRGTSNAGKVLLYYSNAATTNAVLAQVASSTNAAAVICPFIAIGQSV